MRGVSFAASLKVNRRLMEALSDQGFVLGFRLDRKGGGRRLGSLAEAPVSPSDGGILWLHLNYRDSQALGWLVSSSGIDPLAVEALVEDETRPRAVLFGKGMVIILRAINYNPGSEPEDMVSLRIWVEPGRVVSMRHRKVSAVDSVAEAVDKGCGPSDEGGLVVMLVETIAEGIAEAVGEAGDVVDELEDEALTGEHGDVRARLSDVRRQLIGIRRHVAPEREALQRLVAERADWLGETHKVMLREASERIVRLMEDVEAARERAAVTQEELSGRMIERASRVMLLLSIVAVIFLPLSLAASLFGMNVGGIPGSNVPWAFGIICLAMAAVAGVEYWIFKRKDWL